MAHGGARKNAGRPRKKEKRIGLSLSLPPSLVWEIKERVRLGLDSSRSALAEKAIKLYLTQEKHD